MLTIRGFDGFFYVDPCRFATGITGITGHPKLPVLEKPPEKRSKDPSLSDKEREADLRFDDREWQATRIGYHQKLATVSIGLRRIMGPSHGSGRSWSWHHEYEWLDHTMEISMAFPMMKKWWIFYITGWWFGTFLMTFHILGIIIPIDEVIFFRGVGSPPTR